MSSSGIPYLAAVPCEFGSRSEDVTHLVEHLEPAFQLARWLVRNEADVEDIVQEAYLRAIRSVHTLRAGESRAWLLAIVRNICYDWLRRRRLYPHEGMCPHVMDSLRSTGPSPEAVLVRVKDAEVLRAALDRLPARLRDVLLLRELEQMTYKEIAASFGIPKGTVMSRISRARRQLARVLKSPLPK